MASLEIRIKDLGRLLEGHGSITGYASQLETQVGQLQHEAASARSARNSVLHEMQAQRATMAKAVSSAHLKILEHSILAVVKLVQAAALGEGHEEQQALKCISDDMEAEGTAPAVKALLHHTSVLGNMVINVFETFNNKMQEVSGRHKDQVQQLEDENRQLLVTVARSGKETKMGADQLDEELEKAEQKLKKLTMSHHAMLQTKEDELEAKDAQYQNSITEVKTLKAELRAQTNQLQQVLADSKQLESKIQKMKKAQEKSQASNSARVQELETQLKAAEKRCQIKEQQSDVTLQEKVAERAQLVKECDLLKQKLQDIEAQLKDSMMMPAASNQEDLKAQIDVLTTKLRKSEKSIKKADKEKESTRKTLEANKNVISELQKRNNTLTDGLEACMLQIDSLTDEIKSRWIPRTEDAKEVQLDEDDEELSFLVQVKEDWPGTSEPKWDGWLQLHKTDVVKVSDWDNSKAPCADDGLVKWYGHVCEDGAAINDAGWFPARYCQPEVDEGIDSHQEAKLRQLKVSVQ